ncbi:cholesterol 24-hydroxylase-like [Amphiura filiformis]|uniref:cholesterol 24-hydroxylase-like n=1 Tax=Amphiura filiformis TaxID=82378 RepID=UPI003B224D67
MTKTDLKMSIAASIAGYSAIIALLVLFIIFIWITLKVHWVHKKYQHIPSVPRPSFYLGHSKYMNEVFGNDDSDKTFEMLMYEWYKELGPVFCFQIFTVTMVIVLDPKGVKDIMLNTSHPKAALSYKVFKKVFGARFTPHSLVAEIDHDKWHKQRVILDVPFRRRFLKDFMTPFNASTNLLIEKLSDKADGKTEVRLADHFNRCTLDVIAKVAFSLDLGIIENENSYFNQAILTALRGMRKSATAYSMMDMRSSARKFRQDVRNAVQTIRDTGRECINKRIDDINRGDVPEDVLTYIIKAGQEVEGNDEEKMEVMIDQFATFFVAGQETTANMLSFTVIALCRHPEILHRLKTEVDAVLGERVDVTYEDINKMGYMMQVLKESLRIWTPVAGTMRELKSDVQVMGHNIPADSLILISMFGLGRMEEYFHNPDEFDPDRFTSDEVTHFTYFPFSLGARNCIGQHFALIEARVILARLIQAFHCELVPGQEFKVLSEITLKPKDGCKVFIQPRN